MGVWAGIVSHGDPVADRQLPKSIAYEQAKSERFELRSFGIESLGFRTDEPDGLGATVPTRDLVLSNIGAAPD